MATHSTPKLVRRLMVYLKPYTLQTVLAISLLIITMLCSVINPYLLKIAIDTYIANNNLKGLFVIGGILLGLNLTSWIISYFRIEIISKITNEILITIRHEFYSHIQTLSFDFFDNHPIGKILARVIGDVNALKDLFNQTIQSLIPELLTLICVAVFMFLLNVKMAIACLVLLPFLVFAMSFIQVYSHKRWLAYREIRSGLNAFSHESFSGMKVIESFANETRQAQTFEGHVEDLSKSFIHAIKLNDFFWPLVDLSWGIGNVVVFFIGYRLVVTGEIQIGTLLAFCMYVGMFWRPIMNLSTFYNTLITNLSAAERIFGILDEVPAIKNIDEATGKPLPQLDTIIGRIIFDHVSFAYDQENLVLDDVNFTVNPGERVALVGPTGAGKTTIISLLSRFYDPTVGRILIDGKDIKKVDLESLRSQMGIMLQDTFLFSTSIMENIRYGRLEATDEQVIAAAKAVNAHNFIMKLEDHYQTVINERGSRLSLGQRQLISFARALLANPRILILDEATSNIDTQTEQLVQEGIEKLLKGRTSFVIAHRLSTIKDCDKIMVVDHNNIIECGTHAQLLQNQEGLYAKLYNAQYQLISEII
nr:ABC transporter ATP-binding protein [Cellulosilyticum ruminicola]